jgi:hypothetical protein
MNSNSLESWQVERLFKRVQQELHFLDRLEGRMHQKHFPDDDLVFDRVKKAREAVQELSIQLHHLTKNMPQ